MDVAQIFTWLTIYFKALSSRPVVDIDGFDLVNEADYFKVDPIF